MHATVAFLITWEKNFEIFLKKIFWFAYLLLIANHLGVFVCVNDYVQRRTAANLWDL